MRSQVRVVVAAVAALLLSAPAGWADQLAALSREQAVKAANFLKTQKLLVLYCGCCSSDGEKRYVLVSKISYGPIDGGYFSVTGEFTDANGTKVTADYLDLAYVHYITGGKAHSVGKALEFESDPCVQPFAVNFDVNQKVAEMQAARTGGDAAVAAAAAQAAAAAAAAQAAAAADAAAKSDVNAIEMVFVKGGTANIANVGTANIGDFSIGKWEVTQGLWTAVMGSNPSYHKGDDNLPVEFVSWNQIQEFLQKLNAKTGKNYRLPTSAEWEYAARGGNKSKSYVYSGSGNIDDVAWYSRNSGKRTQPVGTKQANELGIYDMTGNVFEWTGDLLGSGPNRILRGGSWDHDPEKCVVAQRFDDPPTYSNLTVGFRLAMSSAQAQTQAAGGPVKDIMARGRKFFDSGDNDKAIAEYSAAVSSPQVSAVDKAAALHMRAQAYFNTKEYDKAAADWSDALKLAASAADKALYNLNRGVAYMYMGEWDKAIPDFTAAIAVKPEGQTYVNRGLAYEKKEDYAKAAADYETALKHSPSQPANVAKQLAKVKAKLQLQKAMGFAVKDEIDNAIKEINEAIKLDPAEIGYVWNRGVFYAEKGDYAAAKTDINAVLKKSPNFPGGKEMLERISEAEKSAEEESAPSRVQAGQQAGPRTGRGVAGSQRGGGHSASPLRFYNRGLNAYNARDYDMAIASFTDAIKINPRDASYYDSRGSAYAKKRDYDRAIIDYTEAIRLSPRRADFYINRGDAYLDKGAHSRAVADYTEAIRLDPKNADYYCNRGDAYMEMMDYRRAADDFDYALRLDPRHPEAQDLLRQAKSQGRGYHVPRGNNRGR